MCIFLANKGKEMWLNSKSLKHLVMKHNDWIAHVREFRIGYHVICNIRVPIFYNEKILLDCLYDMMEFQRQFTWRILATKGNEMWLFDKLGNKIWWKTYSKKFIFEFIAHHMTILGDKGKEMWWKSNNPKVLKLWLIIVCSLSVVWR